MSDLVHFRPPFAMTTPGTVRLMVDRHVGRNARAVFDAMTMAVYEDRSLGRRSARQIAELTGLSEKQVARGKQELRKKKIIVPVTRKNQDGEERLDRPSFGHVPRFCITREVWERYIVPYIK